MINIVLFQPEIPPNTGNIIRLAANTGCGLHLIAPLGFSLDDKRLRRAGLDYHEFAALRTHENWEVFAREFAGHRLFGVSTRGQHRYSDIEFAPGDCLIFGPETQGLPDWLRSRLGPDRLLRLPMLHGSRSLNLSNAAAVLIYEAWRQLDFAGGQ